MWTPKEAQRELDKRVKAELRKRKEKDPEAYKAEVVKALRAELFDKQLAVMDDPSRRISLCCSRRAGKSELCARMLAIALLEGQRNDYCLFAAKTLQRAKQIILSILERISEEFVLDFHIQAHVGQVTTPDGAVLMLLGVDDVEAVEKVRGSRYRLAVCDEAATYEKHLSTLITDCIAPGTIDVNGRILVAGTPGYVRRGQWHSIAEGEGGGYSRYHWTLADNPHIKNAERALAEEREANGWTESDPIYQREYLGFWSADATTLVYAYDGARNDVRALPEPPPDMAMDEWIRSSWLTTVAADIGFTDDFAVVCLGSPPHSKDVYVLHTYREAELLVGAQAELIKATRDRFKPHRTVIDAGGQGKLTFEEFNARYGKQAGGVAVRAEKRNKIDAIGLMNSDLRSGVLKVFMPSCAVVTEEWRTLPWEDPETRDKEHAGFRNHVADCALYAWRAHKAFLAKAAPGKKTQEELERERDDDRNRRTRAAMMQRR